MKQPAPVYENCGSSMATYLAFWRYTHIFSSCAANYGIVVLIRGEIYLSSVGDVMDRGPQSLRCLQLLEQHWVRAVRGNHEQMAMDALASGMSLWLMNGGDWFIALADNQQKQRKRRWKDLRV